MATRTYEIVVLGATGFTGVYIVEAVAQFLPTDLKWAIAGRSEQKLSTLLSQTIKPVNPDRADPAIETCTLDYQELDVLTKKTKVLINAIGPYHIYSEPVVKACAENGTHYIDCTGEVPWVRRMLLKYDETAKKSGAIIIPESGFESAVSDLLVWQTVSEIRTALNANTTDVIASLHNLDSRVISGGTLSTILTLFSSFPLSEIQQSFTQWSLAPEPGKPLPRPTLWTLLTGLSTIPGLGQLTTSVTGQTNAAIVHRSASLLSYGPNFTFEEKLRPRSTLFGILTHYFFILASLLILLPPLRLLLSKLVYAPGSGPARKEKDTDSVEYRAIGHADDGSSSSSQKRVFARLTNQGNMYKFTGTLLAVGAAVLAREVESSAAERRRGLCTPAMLGDAFVQGMRKTGMSLEASVLDDDE
ncbi:MAG: hypothetical protein GOMPHAMPRED_006218 [Gomphillus americanus]|uniref:Saccharopine dehydrogenase NADP binding domain-containing protein n=1 Tax=Gomphillus americanus TaxID=1940652 RepID=A0A8H3EQG9_9LECA|nr:MAG: hypothetical protein GOMPHAMPRED_006218 [Gomphillus americanus]